MAAIHRFLISCLVLLGATSPVSARTTDQPYFGDRLAYVPNGKLYVGFPHARLVSGPGNAFQPMFSADGRWLAFLRQQWNGYDVSSQLSPSLSASSPTPPAPILAGVATDSSGHVYVADTQGGRIFVLSSTLQLRTIWTIPRPSGPAHLVGLAIGRHNMVYATDLGGRIFALSPRGRVRAVWGSPGRAPGQFEQPWGIAIGAAGNVVVADNYNHRIQTLSPIGKPLARWQIYSRHDSPGGPCGLQYLAINARGQVYASDDCYDRVFKLAPPGKILQIWGQQDHHLGQFSGVAGVAVAPSGNVFVAETFRILRFAPNGRLLGFIREPGYPGYPFTPAGVAVDRRGMIYVADAENYRVFKLSPSGQTLAVRCLRRSGCKGSYALRSRTEATRDSEFGGITERGAP